jgi:hypothetical protein
VSTLKGPLRVDIVAKVFLGRRTKIFRSVGTVLAVGAIAVPIVAVGIAAVIRRRAIVAVALLAIAPPMMAAGERSRAPHLKPPERWAVLRLIVGINLLACSCPSTGAVRR